jgi:hypothetical protein
MAVTGSLRLSCLAAAVVLSGLACAGGGLAGRGLAMLGTGPYAGAGFNAALMWVAGGLAWAGSSRAEGACAIR